MGRPAVGATFAVLVVVVGLLWSEPTGKIYRHSPELAQDGA